MATYRLLLVDDDPAVLRSLSEYFKRLGHDVQQAADGKSGLLQFDRFHPDVVILDLHLPDITGLKVLEEIRKRGGLVVMLTGEGDVDTAVEAMRLGAENFLTKPVEMAHLLATVEKAAEKGILRRENEQMREQLHPDIRRRLIRFGVFIVLLGASLWVGSLIGGGAEARPSVPIPIRLREDSERAAQRDSVYRPPLPPGGGVGSVAPPPVRH